MSSIQRAKSQECFWPCGNRVSMIAIEALRLKIDTLQLERWQFESKNSKLELKKNHYKEEHEHLMVENEQLKALYEELLKKIEEEDAVGRDKTSETALI